MEGSRNNACIVPDNMSFFDSEYGAYTDDLEYISSYVADDVQRYFNLNVKPGTKLGTDLVRGLREDLSATVHNSVGGGTIMNKGSHSRSASKRATDEQSAQTNAHATANLMSRVTRGTGAAAPRPTGTTGTRNLIDLSGGD